jgi:hypothetical protein
MVRNFVALPETSLLLSMSKENESQRVFQQTVATFEYFIAPKRKGLGKDCPIPVGPAFEPDRTECHK